MQTANGNHSFQTEANLGLILLCHIMSAQSVICFANVKGPPINFEMKFTTITANQYENGRKINERLHLTIGRWSDEHIDKRIWC